MSDFATAARVGLEQAGLPLAPDDLELLEIVAGVFEPAMRALDEADLAVLPVEADLDPARAPR